jgi:hypothetical protein
VGDRSRDFNRGALIAATKVAATDLRKSGSAVKIAE